MSRAKQQRFDSRTKSVLHALIVCSVVCAALSLSLFLLLSPSSLVHVLKPIPPPLANGIACNWKLWFGAAPIRSNRSRAKGEKRVIKRHREDQRQTDWDWDTESCIERASSRTCDGLTGLCTWGRGAHLSPLFFLHQISHHLRFFLENFLVGCFWFWLKGPFDGRNDGCSDKLKEWCSYNSLGNCSGVANASTEEESTLSLSPLSFCVQKLWLLWPCHPLSRLWCKSWSILLLNAWELKDCNSWSNHKFLRM